MFVIGTAGHVDHGKSTLIEALTGIDPDRLAEEKEREMTIDLGFAWITLGEGDAASEVGIVDVPGHRDFIENMLAGVGGIDLALFVVAADEGVMPQTSEHLAILDLLEVRGGVVALTKVDLVTEPDWLELVQLDLHDVLAGTVLADAPIVPISARTGLGIADLKRVLWERLQATPPRPDNGRPRLSIDRVFSLSGFGTVVTGTLIDGRFQLGDAIEIQPSGKKGRIRGLQTHKLKRDVAFPGSRVAINLTGIDKDEVNRGDVVAAPGVVGSTILLDAAYRHLPDADAPLKHNVEVKLFVGAKEVLARTRVLGQPQINPGEEGWLQLELSEPVAAARGDRFILRRPSPGATLGGGHILDPHPGRKHRRFRPEVVQRLQTLAQGTPAELLLQALARLEPTTVKKLLAQAGMDEETAVINLKELRNTQQIVQIEQNLLTRAGWQQRQDKLQQLVKIYHHENPLRLGIPREELRSRLRLNPAIFNPLLATAVTADTVREAGGFIHIPGHAIRFSTEQQATADALLRRFTTAGVNSPSVKEARAEAGEAVYLALVDLGELRPLNAEVVYAKAEYEQYTAKIVRYLQERQTINAAQVRDLLNTSRKYAIALLEHLDDIKTTRRVGDNRVLAAGS
ncbi:MAG: selenocysteine-specific translation elongation factor [Ardenticatenaceae bacterium]|nr:selenocysteine-specific translation elongation factor [Ardenticatenaceae bacterium]MCB8990757.1 selenocysteine-specific translation elongation factor [Ardenticatenaceae bacterium]MCB9003244.1 selenocysteine-specific translation elongation factor [Ardenticatenaceae bacterium]